jgi:hypothetical protein
MKTVKFGNIGIPTCHTEFIKCPNCGYFEHAKVEHTLPFYTYIHECTYCNYLIMESEWDEQ